MTPVFSIYLDLIRFLSAMAVFVAHVKYERFTGGWLGFFGDGNYAVMVFFVLSGYVISYVANEKEARFYDFTVSRFARLYSVVIPAIILTAFFDLAGPRFDKSLYDGWWYQESHAFIRLLINSLFLQELWFFSIRPLTNGPFWSLGYEFWYYILFGVFFYLRGRAMWFWGLLVLLIAGPKIMLLAPVWLMGVGTYYFNKKVKLSWKSGVIIFALSIIGYLFYQHLEVASYLKDLSSYMLGDSIASLQWSKRFMENYVIGVFVMLNIAGFYAFAEKLEKAARSLKKPVQLAASYTFTLYLLHYPALHFFAAVSANDPEDLFDQAFIVISTLLLCLLVGTFTERKKHRLKALLLGWSQRLKLAPALGRPGDRG